MAFKRVSHHARHDPMGIHTILRARMWREGFTMRRHEVF
jgi:hypothetical protein